MKCLLASLALLTFASFASDRLVAADGNFSAQNFATVKLFFLNQWLPDPRSPKMGGSSQGGMGGGMGGMMSTQNRFETARLFLDDKFVSHVMFRHVEVKPTLNLPPGDHRFRVECDGYAKFEQTLTVLDNGSVQWLVVKLEPAKDPESAAAPSLIKD